MEFSEANTPLDQHPPRQIRYGLVQLLEYSVFQQFFPHDVCGAVEWVTAVALVLTGRAHSSFTYQPSDLTLPT